VVGSGTGRWPEQARCGHMASVEGITRGEKATGKPGEPSRPGLFVLATVEE